MSLIITDLDNTLYDWVTYFARSFSAMVDALETQLGIDRETLLGEFKAAHKRYGNSEQPFAVLELPSVVAALGTDSPRELTRRLEPSLDVFNQERLRTLKLYDGVRETLEQLTERGHVVVGHTEAAAINSYYRLVKLGVEQNFRRLFALEGRWLEHPVADRRLDFPNGFVHDIPLEERKPNPALLLDICASEGFDPQDALYVGDSLSRDISMAKSAGVFAVWARYGTVYDRQHWSVLVKITHWTEEDVARDERLRTRFAGVEPDATIDSFRQVADLVERLGDAHGGGRRAELPS